jgi:signal transduction histidine kinase
MTRLLTPFVRPETYRSFLYYLATVVLGSIGLALLIAGWTISLLFAITPLVIPLLIGFRLGVGALAGAGAGLARQLLGTTVKPPVDTKGAGFWGRGFAVLKDDAFWKQQAHLLASWVIAVVALAPFSLGVQMLAIPFYYHAVDGLDMFWRSNVDTLSEALEFVPIGLALVVIGVYLLGPFARLSRALTNVLLAGEADRPVRSRREIRVGRVRALTIHAIGSAAVALLLVVIWAATTAGYFWPIWVILPLAHILGIHAWVVAVAESPRVPRLAGGDEALAAHIGIAVLIFAFLVGIWAATTRGYFWPIWPLLGLAVTVIVHAAVVLYHRSHRVEVLETSRAGAVDNQEVELRRIERDLHDGAQARLVALGMSLGMAEQKLATDPEAARELLAEARLGAGEALEELRDLARGIHPPVLTDRGLAAAVAALAAQSPLQVALLVDVPQRPPGAVETAAYFVVAEAIANAGKYARATRLDIRIQHTNGVLSVEVADDGTGGADPAGDGLTGLRRRVEALDGTLIVTSPSGGPTTVKAELPCGS